MTPANLNGQNRLHSSPNEHGNETKQKRDSKQTKPGRDARGRFVSANAGRPGNPLARRAHFRKLVLETVTDEDLKAIVVALILKAKEGDVAAARLLLAYRLGTPARLVVRLKASPAL